MLNAEIEKSNRHLREFWQLSAKARTPGEVLHRDGLTIANARQPWFFLNVAMLNAPIADGADLKRKAQIASSCFKGANHPWVLTASEDWLGPGAESILVSVGLERKLELTGMLAERLRPPLRPLPEAPLRRIADVETRFALADLNADANSVPRDWGRQAIGSAALWDGPLFGRLAYVNGEAAAGAFAVPIDKALYVGWVATAKRYRRLSLAELVIRASLEDAREATRLERTVLHATNEGRPVYTRMGYRSVVSFPYYVSAEGQRPSRFT
jgi:hypothetical protein